jgi:hypothetical protein
LEGDELADVAVIEVTDRGWLVGLAGLTAEANLSEQHRNLNRGETLPHAERGGELATIRTLGEGCGQVRTCVM